MQFTLLRGKKNKFGTFTYKNHLDLLEQILHICMYSSKASDLLAYLSFYQLWVGYSDSTMQQYKP